jgi:hypothetical protein
VFTPHFKEHLVQFWVKTAYWLVRNFTLGGAFIFFFVVLNTPMIIWALYLIIYDPIDVYDIAPKYARSWNAAMVIALATFFFATAILAYYLAVVYKNMKIRYARRVEAKRPHTNYDDEKASLKHIETFENRA